MTDIFTDLEARVLEMLLAGEHPVLAALRMQLLACRVVSRTVTSCGFFTDIDVNRTAAAAPVRRERLIFGDVTANIVGLRHGAGFILLVTSGYLDMLEGYSYDEAWIESPRGFEVSYVGASRDIRSLKLDS